MKIEISNLKGVEVEIYGATLKQMDFIESLMKQKKMEFLFTKYFKNAIINNYCKSLTKANASRLIKQLLNNNPDKPIAFKEVKTTPILKERKLKIKYVPTAKFNSDTPKINFEEMQAKLNNYED